MKRPVVLTIAGSDCSGGAGIQADLKTMLACGVYGASAITALTAQNTTGVFGVEEVSPDFLARQIEAVFTDLHPAAVKVGMVSSAELIGVIAQQLRAFEAVHIVIDPVMISTSGTRLLRPEAAEALAEDLFPLAELITPNLPEAETLWGHPLESEAELLDAAHALSERYSCAVLCKGGHGQGGADDLLFSREKAVWFRGERLANPNTHGTGCTLSSAIASQLALGQSLTESVRLAKAYLTGALRAGLDLGAGSGPLDHGFAIPPWQG